MAVSTTQTSDARLQTAVELARAKSQPARRLIGLITSSDWGDPEYPRQIWSLAAPSGSPVVLLGIVSDPVDEAAARRHLVSMAAAIQNERVPAQFTLLVGRPWIESVQAMWRPGDLVVCCRRPPEGWLHLSGTQSPAPQFPLHVLAGSEQLLPAHRSLALRVLSWTGNVAILGGCLWLQVQLAQQPGEALRLAQVSASLLAEFGLLWVWNALTA